jgi:predicted NAD/FAD-binding protein
MRVAVVGSGISSLTAAYYLRERHDVIVYEAADYVGGHTHTIDVETPHGLLPIDTGFIVFNERSYPNFCRLLAELNVLSQPSDMSFSVSCGKTGLEYSGCGLNGLFAQRLNLLRPRFWRLIRDWRRFGREAMQLLETPEESLTVAEYFKANPYSREFRESYFLPMGSAVWSCPHEVFEEFPMRFLVAFYHHHGLLTLRDPPAWRVIQGGSREYVRALVKRLPRTIQLRTPVRALVRRAEGVELRLANGSCELFDHVILGCHSDQALRLLGASATTTERQVLGAFSYQENTATLHTDTNVLPRHRRAWASWNYFVPERSAEYATVTYHMNRLQGLTTSENYCVSLNQEARIDPRKVIRTMTYHHPVFGLSRLSAQMRHHDLIDHDRVSYCGAYWGNGFHEDGVNSGLAVCKVLNARHATETAGAA